MIVAITVVPTAAAHFDLTPQDNAAADRADGVVLVGDDATGLTGDGGVLAAPAPPVLGAAIEVGPEAEALAGKTASPHKYLYWRWGSKSAAIRMGRYKLLREQQSTNQDWQLFDLQTDIGETANLSSAKPQLAEKLKAEFERWEKEAIGG